ncbi:MULTISPECIES: DUF3108 domain-containing protein [Fibrobacter]|uniref:DUF3108 domain-containing protein n=1 Tax=Fibrobacter TaxID=832 RepID=UPI0015665622|nr:MULTISPECIES: DUF3108 domain-containing protein [Fibrobacter]MBR4784886.1 DUF3108 domain-containing protein [Fibrobacter sp.]
MFRGYIKMSSKVAALVAFLVAVCFAGEPNLPEVQTPWMKGEKLTFSLGWGPITAGEATLEVKSLPGGKTEFLTFAHGNSTISRIYPVFDTVYTRVRNKGLMTEVFRKNLHEGTFHNTSVIRFDRKGEKAWLSDTVFTDMKTRKVKRSADTAVTIQGVEHSIMSAFYYVRTMPLTVGDTSRFSAVSGKKRYELKVLVHGKEQLKTAIGTVNTVKIEPVLDGDGIFNSKGRIFIWLTEDERRIPVLMECEIALGSIKAKLKKAE